MTACDPWIREAAAPLDTPGAAAPAPLVQQQPWSSSIYSHSTWGARLPVWDLTSGQQCDLRPAM
eukprot:CAMPEP_0202910558 /NCGR_PEP_ID=MMETSP1392-20130828/52322_1 /ASSEMBLY_ACC=CAM_ASM_000868 /TAXON_ID=225041 /ORGANISM="Chlamydomonas chlamydogama, Strain SAG 11-48b" /LENGTH=63 /DNA_ID=CAMNT_0049600701 /DNA_START=293 /DNA_END=484 /DNA_ORIENTATION=+